MKKIIWINNYNHSIPSVCLHTKPYISFTRSYRSFMRTLWDKQIYSKYLIFGQVTNDSFNKESVKLENLNRVKRLSSFFYTEFINFLIENNLTGTDKLDPKYYSLINSKAYKVDYNAINTDNEVDMVGDLSIDCNEKMIQKIYNHWKDPNIKENFTLNSNYYKEFGNEFIANKLLKDNPDAIVIDLAIFYKDYESITNGYPVFSMALYDYLFKISNIKNVYLLSFSSFHAENWIETFKKYWDYPDEELPIIYGVNGKATNLNSSLNLLDILKNI